MPPAIGPASKITTWWPRRARCQAVESPLGPAPTTSTRRDVGRASGVTVQPSAKLDASAGPLTLQTSVYVMDLENELHFSPATFTNSNFDPTRRFGVENILTWQV